MFSNNKKLVISINRTKIRSGLVELGDTPEIDSLAEGSWTDDNLVELFKKIKSHYGDLPVRIVLGDDISYVLELLIPNDVENERSFIGLKITEKIPDILEDNDWDYKLIEADEKGRKIKVFAPVKSYLKKISFSASEAGLEIEAVEPVFLSKERNPEPMIGIALKTDIKGKDENVLNVVPKEITKEENKETTGDQIEEEEREVQVPLTENEKVMDILSGNKEEKIEEEKKKIHPKFIIIGIIILFLLLLAGGIIIYLKSMGVKPFNQNSKEPVATVSPAVQATPTLMEIRKEDLKINIQNGGGKAGAAGVAKTYLEGLGYRVGATGNADSFTYEKSEISIKESKKTFLDDLVKSFSQKYSLSEKYPSIDEGNEFDVIIKIGKY